MLYVVLFVKYLEEQQWMMAILCVVVSILFQWMDEDEETEGK